MRTITAYNLASDGDESVMANSTPTFAVVISHLIGEGDMAGLRSLAIDRPTDDELRARFPITEGRLSVACGDWVALKQ